MQRSPLPDVHVADREDQHEDQHLDEQKEAVGHQLAAFLELTPGATPPRDVEHLRRQQLVIDTATAGGWRAVPEEDTRLCQPETAPQAMVTNRIGHSGPNASGLVSTPEQSAAAHRLPDQLVKAGKSAGKAGCQTSKPMVPAMIPRNTIQKAT